MYDSFIDQLSGLELSGLSIRAAPFNETDFPCEDAIEQTLGAVSLLLTYANDFRSRQLMNQSFIRISTFGVWNFSGGGERRLWKASALISKS